jgi:hypothetical protein
MTKMNNTPKKSTWTTEDIFEAHFIFPTKHYECQVDMEKDNDSSFFKICQNLIEQSQPLTEIEQEKMRKAVNSDNRLRVYSTALNLFSNAMDALNDTQEIDTSGIVDFEDYEKQGYTVKDPQFINMY